jgi:hypothetical protein
MNQPDFFISAKKNSTAVLYCNRLKVNKELGWTIKALDVKKGIKA